LRSVMGRLESAERFIVEVTDSPVAIRVAHYLLDLPGKAKLDGVTVQLPLAKKDVASLLGITPESLSRQLGILQSAGVITVRGRSIEIHDPSRLEDQLAK